MDTTRIIKWTNSECKIVKTKNVHDNIGFADGWNINLGKETYDGIEISISQNGKIIIWATDKPRKIDPKFCGNYKDLITRGAYARLGDNYISEPKYNDIMAAIAEMNAELDTNPEYTAVKQAEIAKEKAADKALENEAAQYAEEIKNGLCPKCGTYCYGDCTA